MYDVQSLLSDNVKVMNHSSQHETLTHILRSCQGHEAARRPTLNRQEIRRHKQVLGGVRLMEVKLEEAS